MSDFDKIIHDKLDGDEEHFPRREHNWERLNARLDAFEMSQLQPPRLRWVQYAQAAAITLLMGTSLWLWAEWQASKKEILALKNNATQAKDTPTDYIGTPSVAPTQPNQFEPTIIVKTDTIYRIQYISVEKAATVAPALAENSPAESIKPIKQTEQPKAPFTTPQFTANAQSNNFNTNQTNIPPQLEKNTTTTQANHTTRAEQTTLLDNPIFVTPDAVAIDNQAIESNTQPRDAVAAIELLPLLPLPHSITTQRQSNIIAQSPSNKHYGFNAVHTQNTSPSEDDLPIIKPQRKRIWQWGYDGIHVGANVATGRILPTIEGVKPTSGKGISAEIKILNRLSVGVTADWVATKFSFRPDIKPINHPLPKPPQFERHEKLEKIRGKHQSSIFGGRISYALTTQSWANPSLSVGFNRITFQRRPTVFAFMDNKTGQPKEKIEIPPIETKRNLLSVGINLEKEISRFTVGVAADFYKDISGGMKTPDIALLRGGVKFRLF